MSCKLLSIIWPHPKPPQLTVEAVADKTLQDLSSNVRTRGHRHAQTDEQALQLRTSIAAVANVQTQGQGITLELLDTPGPNEAGEEHLRYVSCSQHPCT